MIFLISFILVTLDDTGLAKCGHTIDSSILLQANYLRGDSAVMRIQYELERILPSQVSAELVWFLAPTVSLCSQQYEYIESQLSAVQVKFLSGADGVERWTEQSLWDGVLRNVRVVVSTYQILLDALTHAFVKMDQLALIVFDEGIFPPASESVAQEVTAQSA
jgi:hypothetical protein